MNGITHNAGAVLSGILEKQDAPEGTCIRFNVDTKGQGSLTLDEKQEDDHVFEHEDESVLLVGPETYEICRNKTLDFANNEFQLC